MIRGSTSFILRLFEVCQNVNFELDSVNRQFLSYKVLGKFPVSAKRKLENGFGFDVFDISR